MSLFEYDPEKMVARFGGQELIPMSRKDMEFSIGANRLADLAFSVCPPDEASYLEYVRRLGSENIAPPFVPGMVLNFKGIIQEMTVQTPIERTPDVLPK